MKSLVAHYERIYYRPAVSIEKALVPILCLLYTSRLYSCRRDTELPADCLYLLYQKLKHAELTPYRQILKLSIPVFYSVSATKRSGGFQFYLSSIKSASSDISFVDTVKFQFYLSSIKRHLIP